MTNAEILAQAEVLAGELHSQARATDEAGLSSEAVLRLEQAGLFTPGRPDEVMERSRVMALGCGASAWLVAGLAAGASVLALADEAVRQTVGAGRVLHIGALDDANLDAGKGLVSGRLGFVGGLDHADWLLITDRQQDEQATCALVRASDVVRHTYDYRGGLRGLNWCGISLDKAPALLVRLDRDQAYHLSEAVIQLGAVMGAAQGGYDDYVATTRARITGIGGQAVAQFTQVQARLAESHAELKSLTGLYETVLAHVREGQATHPETVRDRVYIARKGVEAVNRLLSQMGAMGLSETNPVQRRYRDLKALACVRGLDWVEHMPAFGKYELGLMDAAE